jgi:hypothetical protein
MRMKTSLLFILALSFCLTLKGQPNAPIDTSCLYLVADSVFWQSGQLEYRFTVANPTTANFSVGLIHLYSLSEGNLDFIPSSFDLLPVGIPPGGTFSGTTTIEGDIDLINGDSLYYLLTAHDTPTHFFCCTNLDTICIAIPPYDPCPEIETQLTPLTNCCYELTLTNNAPQNIIQWVDVALLNPDAQFDNIQNIPGGIANPGTSSYQFCIDTSSPLSVQWGGGEQVLCADTFQLDCIDCFDIITDTLACGMDDDQYEYTFSFTNASDYIVNAIELIDTSGLSIWRSGVFPIGFDVAPGATATDITIPVDSMIFSTDSICLLMVLRQQLSNGISIRCCNKEICLPRPDCTPSCCRSPEEIQQDADMGFEFIIDCMTLRLSCMPLAATECDLVRWAINPPNSNVTIGGMTAQNSPIAIGINTNGTYTICMELLRYDEEGNLCFPDEVFEYCTDVEVFCQTLGCFDDGLINPDVDCGQFANPICGCDDMNYINPCAAETLHGISEYTPGPCTPWYDPIFLLASGQSGGSIALSWDIPQYYEIDYFAVRRQQWFNSWMTIGYVDANLSTFSYSFTDNQPTPGFNTYQIIGATLEGKAIFSPPATATPGLSPQYETTATIWPNPADEVVHIRFVDQGEKRLRLMESTGQILLDRPVNQGEWQVQLNTTHLHAGLYFLEIYDEQGSRWQQKVILE